MERALESVPADAAQQKDPAALLKGLRDGIALTHKTLEKVTLAEHFAHVKQAPLVQSIPRPGDCNRVHWWASALYLKMPS